MFSGSIVALITPMDDEAAVDEESLQTLIDYHVVNKTSAIVVAGTTGEAATLEREEHVSLVLKAVELAAGRIPIIAGTGSNATRDAISLTQRFEGSKVAACLTITPYYNCPTQEGLYRHFEAIAKNTELPQILYNVPSRTGCDLLPETVLRLAQIPNIIGLKEATGNLERLSMIKAKVNDDFILLSGDDATGFDFIKEGGQGIISVTANVAAGGMTELCQRVAESKFTEAGRLNERLMPLHKELFIEANPIVIKWACKRLGLITAETLRLPMTSLTLVNQKRVEDALKSAGLLS